MRIAVLLSGGVDSSVALALLQRAGEHDVTAFYLKIWLEEELSFLGDCPWEEDLRYARAVCRQLGVPLEAVPLQAEYLERVVEPSLAELRAGGTPSPDVFCNRLIKFGAFADRVGGDFARVASGHYARRVAAGERFQLCRSPDPVKDQTYFLSRLRQEQLGRACFPLGPYTKAQVRKLASATALPTADRPDSQGICFLGRIRYRDFVRFRLGERPGQIREAGTERVLGEHRGYWFHTIGQRFGLGLGGGPWYVVSKDVDANVVRVVHRDRLAAHSRRRFAVTDLHWIDQPPAHPELEARLRHGPQLVPCRVTSVDQALHHVELASPDPGLAPGQHAVFYDGQVCLGGGIVMPQAVPASP